MKNYIKYVVIGGVCLLVGVFLGTHWNSNSQFIATSPSPSGTTFSTAKIATVEITLTSTSTIASLVNNGTDAIIESAYCYLNSITGVGTDSGLVRFTAATSTVATGLVNSAGNANTNYIANQFVSTTTNTLAFNPQYFRNPMNSTTTAVVGNVAGSALGSTTMFWAGGGTTYINFIADEPLTTPTTGICGVSYLSL